MHSLLADGDDNAGVPDDEDGVTFGPVQVGQLEASVTVTVGNAPGGARLDAWIDFNGDGSWGGPLEQIADSVLVVNGSNVLTFDVPSTAADGTTIARFRLSTAGNLGVRGAASDGEVEDYAITINPPVSAPASSDAHARSPRRRMVRTRYSRRTWTATATWTCSPHRR